MAVDFDRLVNSRLAGIFGRPARYYPADDLDGSGHEITGIFDRHHLVVLDEVAASEMSGAGHSTTAPVLTVRLTALPVPPRQGAEIVIGDERFQVWDVQPDGEGDADLVLRERVDWSDE